MHKYISTDVGLANGNIFRVQRILRNSGNNFTAQNFKQHFQVFFIKNVFLLLNTLFQPTGQLKYVLCSKILFSITRQNADAEFW